MLYLGHFSFADMKDPGSRGSEPWHGYFTALAEAPNADTAIKKLRRLLHKLGGELMFEGVREIYLDACVEIRTMPAQGFLAHLSSRPGEDLGSVSTSLRGAKQNQATVFDLGPDDEEEHTCEPFIVLRPRLRLVSPRQGRAAGGTRRKT